jgi:hypothetical protein
MVKWSSIIRDEFWGEGRDREGKFKDLWTSRGLLTPRIYLTYSCTTIFPHPASHQSKE